MSVHPNIIANEFIDLRDNEKTKKPFTTMELLKLVYLEQIKGCNNHFDAGIFV